MTERICLVIIIAGMLLGASCSKSHTEATPKSSDDVSKVGMSSYNTRFVDLIFGSQMIAVGRILEIHTSQGESLPESFVFEVLRSLRQPTPARLNVVVPQDHTHAQVDIQQDEPSLLFIQKIEGDRATLLGNAHLGIWPRKKADWLFSAGHVQSVDSLVRVIEAILEVDRSEKYDERASYLIDDVFFNNSLGVITALQFSTSQKFWPDSLSGTTNYHYVKQLLAAKTLVDRIDLDIYAEFALIELMRDLPLSISIPRWIAGLSDTEISLRDANFAALKSEAERWTEDDFGYESRSAEDANSIAIGRWESWFEKLQAGLMRDEVPELLAQLDSNVMLERESANLCLRLIAFKDQQFKAAADEASRREAAQRWHQWWREKLAELDSKK